MLELIPHHHIDEKIELSSPTNPTEDDIEKLSSRVRDLHLKQPNSTLDRVIKMVLDHQEDIPENVKIQIHDLINQGVQQSTGVRLPVSRKIKLKKIPHIKIIDYKMRQWRDDTEED